MTKQIRVVNMKTEFRHPTPKPYLGKPPVVNKSVVTKPVVKRVKEVKEKTTFMGYQTYNFVDKDPIIDQVRTMIDDEAVTLSYVCNKSGVAKKTVKNWFSGQTRRPLFSTIAAVGRALGYDLMLRRNGKK